MKADDHNEGDDHDGDDHDGDDHDDGLGVISLIEISHKMFSEDILLLTIHSILYI